MTTMDNTPTPERDPNKPLNVTLNLTISPTALALVRHDFNPSKNLASGLLKLLAAAFISECETIRDRGPKPWDQPPDPAATPAAARHHAKLKDGSRCAALAITEAETAAMWAVKAATAAL